jgi:hypothetical protein
VSFKNFCRPRYVIVLFNIVLILPKLLLFIPQSTESAALQLLNIIYSCGTIADLQSFLPTIFNLLLQRLQDSVKVTKNVPYAKHLLHNFCIFATVFGPQLLYETLDKLTPGLVTMLVCNIWSANREYWPLAETEIKQVLVGGTKLLVESTISTQPDVWKSLFASLQALSVQKAVKRPELSLDDDVAEDRAFDSAYSKLSFASVPLIDPSADVTSGAAFFAKKVAELSRMRPGQYSALIGSVLITPEAVTGFQALLQAQELSIA